MAEKEERVLVLKATEDDFIYKHFNGKGFIPRQEVTDKMAEAIIREDGEGISYLYAHGLAKAALDALLEDK